MESDKLLKNIQRTLPYAQMKETLLPLCPEIKLYLLDPVNMSRRFSVKETQNILHTTPYWSFCWASGQALAYYILQHPMRFRGRSVIDFGSGSGVVAIAASMAGAARVIACDMDPNAIAAIQTNALLNNVAIKTCMSLENLSDSFDMLLAADVLYDPGNHYLIQMFKQMAPEIMIADSRLKITDVVTYKSIMAITTATLPDLHESEEFKHVKIYYADMREGRSMSDLKKDCFRG